MSDFDSGDDLFDGEVDADELASTQYSSPAAKRNENWTTATFAFEQLDLKSGSKAPGEHGVSIVVSPLIALMKDQVDALQRRNLAAECLDSTKTWEQVQQIYARLRQGTLRLLYCAPERLNNGGFVETMRHVRGGVRLLAVTRRTVFPNGAIPFVPSISKLLALPTRSTRSG